MEGEKPEEGWAQAGAHPHLSDDLSSSPSTIWNRKWFLLLLWIKTNFVPTLAVYFVPNAVPSICYVLPVLSQSIPSSAPVCLSGSSLLSLGT